MEIKIYGLVDPRNNVIRYVGKTKNTLVHRLSKHMCEQPKHNTHKHNWILSLKRINLKPIIIELEKCNEYNWVEREQFWINKIDNLTNLTAGGEGTNFFADQVLVKISEALKKKWDEPEYRKNISKQRTLYWSDIKNREKQGDKLRDKNISEEHKQNIINGRKDNKPIIVNGIKYKSIKGACRDIPILRQTLKRRLGSKKFPEYKFEELCNTVQND